MCPICHKKVTNFTKKEVKHVKRALKKRGDAIVNKIYKQLLDIPEAVVALAETDNWVIWILVFFLRCIKWSVWYA